MDKYDPFRGPRIGPPTASSGRTTHFGGRRHINRSSLSSGIPDFRASSHRKDEETQTQIVVRTPLQAATPNTTSNGTSQWTETRTKATYDPDIMGESALVHWSNFLEHGSLEELKKAIEIDRQLIIIHHSYRDPTEFEATENLGVCLLNLYEATHERKVLDEAHTLLEHALSSMTAGHPSLPRAKFNLGDAWRAKSELQGDDEMLDKAIEFYEAGLIDTPADHPLFDMQLRKSCLARALIARGSPADLSRAVSLMAANTVRGKVQLSSLPTRPNILGLPVPDLTSGIKKMTDFPSGGGGFADIYLSEWIQPGNGRSKVAVKVLRPRCRDSNNPETNEKLKKLLKSEVGIWHELRHPNVVKLLGICTGFGPYASMVCPWFANGNLPTFLQKHKSLVYAERLRLVREIASGLYYLHSNMIIHGDLSGANVLIDDEQRACLSDFGLSVLAQDLELSSTTQSSSSLGGSLRWSAPELYEYGDATPKATLFSDVYSFGSVALEVFSGKQPYHYVQEDVNVLLNYVLKRVKPTRPSGIQDEHWDVIDRCWAADPTSRPSSKSLTGLFTCIEEIQAQESTPSNVQTIRQP